MKRIIAEHPCNAYLKPGEVIVSHNPILVNTVLGSCVAIKTGDVYVRKLSLSASICACTQGARP